MGTHPIFESDFDCLTDGLKRISDCRCRPNWHAPTLLSSSTTTALILLVTKSPPSSRRPRSTVSPSGPVFSLVLSRTLMSPSSFLTSEAVSDLAQPLEALPPPEELLRTHPRRKPRKNPPLKTPETTIWDSDSSIKPCQ